MIVVVAALILWGCTNIPDSYAPPMQRKPLTGPLPSQPGHFVNMGDPNAGAYLVQDISNTAEGAGYRWAYRRPELRFVLGKTDNLKFVMDFAIPAITMQQTGPVTISFFINGQPLDKVRYDTPGEKHYEKPVPASWLRMDEPTLVATEIDKLYIAPHDGAKLSFVISRAGFTE